MQLGGGQIHLLDAVAHELVGGFAPLVIKALLLLVVDLHNILIQKELADLVSGDFLVDDQIFVEGVAHISVIERAAVRADHIVEEGEDTFKYFIIAGVV